MIVPFLKGLGVIGIQVGKNVVTALMTKKMLRWTARKYSASTKTLVDDSIVKLLDGGLDNDPDMIREAVQELANVWLPNRNKN